MLYFGNIWGPLEELKLTKFDLLKELDKVKEYDSAKYFLSRGNVWQNENSLKGFPNERVIFEVDLRDIDYTNPSFSGYLYPDGKVLGKFKYPKQVEIEYDDENFEGIFNKHNDEIIMFGKWNYDKDTSDFYFIELFPTATLK